MLSGLQKWKMTKTMLFKPNPQQDPLRTVTINIIEVNYLIYLLVHRTASRKEDTKEAAVEVIIPIVVEMPGPWWQS